MVRFYTYLICLTSVLAFHDHYKHLDLNYIGIETRRLTYMSEKEIYAKIENNRKAIKLLTDRHRLLKESKSEEEAAAQWKQDFENEYADDFDRALTTQTYCQMMFRKPDNYYPEECDVGIKWDHAYDTRDEDLRKEFLQEVDHKIKEVLQKVKNEQKSKPDL